MKDDFITRSSHLKTFSLVETKLNTEKIDLNNAELDFLFLLVNETNLSPRIFKLKLRSKEIEYFNLPPTEKFFQQHFSFDHLNGWR